MVWSVELALSDAEVLYISSSGVSKRPVDEKWTADEVGSGDQAPVAAVVAVGTVVAHDEVHAGWNDEIFTLDVGEKVKRPLGGDFASFCW